MLNLLKKAKGAIFSIHGKVKNDNKNHGKVKNDNGREVYWDPCSNCL